MKIICNLGIVIGTHLWIASEISSVCRSDYHRLPRIVRELVLVKYLPFPYENAAPRENGANSVKRDSGYNQ